MNPELAAKIKMIDRRYLNGRVRQTHSKFFILGQHWAEFADAIKTCDINGNIIVDVGAGDAPYRAKIEHATYLPLDIKSDIPEWGNHNLSVFGSALALPVKPNSVDAVVSQQVLEHLPDPKRALSEMAGSLKPGGKIFLSVPQSWPTHHIPHDYFRFTEFGLRGLFAEVGLDIDRVVSMGGNWSTLLVATGAALGDPSFEGNKQIQSVTRPARNLLTRVFVHSGLPVAQALDLMDKNPQNTLGWFVYGQKRAY